MSTRKKPKARKTVDRARLGRASRNKGKSHEREVAIELKPIYPLAKRGIGQTRQGGEVPDVTGTPWWVEAKHRKAVNVHAAFEQALTARDASTDEYMRVAPVLVVTRKHGSSRDLVTMDLVEFRRIIAAMQNAQLGESEDGERAGAR